MKIKHCIGRILTVAASICLIAHSAAAAADKVVVIPLDGGSGESGGVSTVTSAGQIWMDRNLGALRVATKSDDSDAYGSLYQWGRLGDGHEYRETPTTSTLSPTDVPGHGYFIMVNLSPWDWKVGQNNTLWQGEFGINNPCPAGFRLPTETEWETERTSWGSNDSAGAFASHLKLVVAGFRYYGNGVVDSAGSFGGYWSSTVDSSYARDLYFHSGDANMDSSRRAAGHSVRCLKD